MRNTRNRKDNEKHDKSEKPKQNEKTDYVDIKTVSEEIDHACRFFEKHKWPVIDVTRISIEEIAATILQMYSHRLKKLC